MKHLSKLTFFLAILLAGNASANGQIFKPCFIQDAADESRFHGCAPEREKPNTHVIKSKGYKSDISETRRNQRGQNTLAEAEKIRRHHLEDVCEELHNYRGHDMSTMSVA